jgi:hypothetical protein
MGSVDTANHWRSYYERDRRSVADWPHRVTGSTNKGTPASSSVSQTREDSRVDSCYLG